ncbi:MAG TPA: DUF4097 family beta strand repeat-containing protein [Gemmatimonadaceae bacterium]|jgi:DUF4097 and DUF4098 domain-containing protein YvlB
MTRRLIPLAFAALVAPMLAMPAAAQTNADFRWSKALPAGNEVEIHNISGDIRVVPSKTGKVEIVGIRRGRGDVDLLKADVEENSHGIVVCVLYDDPNGSCDDNHSSRHNDRNWNDARMDFEVSVPTNLRVSAGSVSGDVSITGAEGDVTATSVSGDVKMLDLRANSVTAHSVSGDVDVRVNQLTGRGDLEFHSVSGDVTLELPTQLDADLSMSTVSGDLNSDFPITLSNGRMNRRRIEARIGKGGRRLELQTVSGDVRIKKIS